MNYFLTPTSVQQWHGAVFIGAVGPGARPVGGAEVDHEVSLLPAVLLQRLAELLVCPDELQHLASPPHLPLRTLSAGRTERLTHLAKWWLYILAQLSSTASSGIFTKSYLTSEMCEQQIILFKSIFD